MKRQNPFEANKIRDAAERVLKNYGDRSTTELLNLINEQLDFKITKSVMIAAISHKKYGVCSSYMSTYSARGRLGKGTNGREITFWRLNEK